MTNKIVLRSVEEFMQDYKPTYVPLFPLLIANGNAVQYAPEVGKMTFERVEAVGDYRLKHLTPKDTEMHQISAKEGSKTFKKYVLASQFINSQIQDQRGNEEVIKQVLDENNKLMDELVLLGEGTSASTMINNGLFWSNDPNYSLESSVEVQKDTLDNHLVDLHGKIMATADDADQVAGRKALIVYGANVTSRFDSIYPESNNSFKEVLQKSLGDQYSMVKMPKAVTPASSHGWIIVNLDQIKFHYIMPPQLINQGVNEEKLYTWHNFGLGSCMVDVIAADGIIRQPATFEA